MKTKVYKLAFALIIALGFLTYSCADLEVENMNEPDSARALANPDDLSSLAGGAFRTFHNAMQAYDGPALSMGTMADQNTCSWGNAAMKDLSSEPRVGFINSLTYSYFPVVRNFWEDSYGAISAVNDVLKAIEEKGIEIGTDGSETEMVKAWCYFVSGVAHGYLGLTYDQANIIEWNTDLETLEMSPYQTVIESSLALLDQAISIAGSASFSLPDKWLGGDSYSNAELAQLANSYAARILAYSSRNKAHNESIDWSKVLNYANNGIKKSLKPVLGSNYGYYDDFWLYQVYPGWGRIDHRIINLMDPDYPSRFAQDGVTWTTADGTDPGEAESADARLLSDMEFLPDNNFRPDRGFYHFSHYRYSRWDEEALEPNDYGSYPKPTFHVWENELLKAEAMARTGNVSGAVTILNDPSGARKMRGQLPDVTSTSATDVLWTVFYEKDVELIDSGMGIAFFDMRRRDMLQRGTILHYPVPMTELEIIQAEIYTIGGAPDGENVSNGSWTGLDGVTSPLN